MDKTPLIAAIDVGTNSFHMVIASLDPRGMLVIKHKDKENVRLGSSAGDMKKIKQDALERGVDALRKFADTAKQYNAKVRAVATSAVREANNQDVFKELVKRETGIEVEVVSGYEEGRLIYNGAIHALPIETQKSFIIDIGGGSTETIIGHKGELKFVTSAKLGAIRMTKAFFPDGVSSDERIEKCREHIHGVWAPTQKRLLEIGFEAVIGTSGTIQNIAAMAFIAKNKEVPEEMNGLSVSREDLLHVIKKILSIKKMEDRAKIPGIDPKRADIILGGALILEHAIIQLNIQKILISNYALREGIVYDTVLKNRAIDELQNLSHLRYESITNLCRKFGVEGDHCTHVKNTALKLFDDLQAMHYLTNREREFLESAAMLHDVGYFISPDEHHKHSYYLIRNSSMPGFTNGEAEKIANIARYHRKSHPKRKHENFTKLTLEQQKTVRILAGILRIAEGIDRRQLQLVKNVKAFIRNNEIFINLYPANGIDTDIELWGAIRRKPLMEETFGKKVIIKIVRPEEEE